MNQALTTTVCVRAFSTERLPDTIQALESVLRQNRTPDEVLLVVDYNAELEGLLRAHFPQIRVISNERKRGIGGGSNTGLLHASGDIIAFLDDDAEADPSWLGSMMTHFEDVDVVGVGGKTLPLWVDREPTWVPAEFYWVFGCSNGGSPHKATEMRNLWGGNNALRRKSILGAGGFLEEGLGRVGTKPVGGEDTELCIRMQQADSESKIIFEPKALIKHKIPAARARFRYFGSRCYHEGRSKALLSRITGHKDGLSDERRHVLVDLPKAVVLGLVNGVVRFRPSELAKVFAIVSGFGLTLCGFVIGRMRLFRTAPSRSERAALS